MNWVSVKYRLPDDHEVVLAAHWPDYCRGSYYVLAEYNNEYQYWSEVATSLGGCSDSMNISHWMPLPELPKEEA